MTNIINIKPIAPIKTRNYDSSVVQFSLDGQPIKAFETIQLAAEYLGKNRKDTSNIRQCADGKLKTAYGFQWRWLKEVK